MKRAETCSCSLCNKLYISIRPYNYVRQVNKFQSSLQINNILVINNDFNPLTPNDHYSGCTAPLTSKRCILYIYSTNIGTEYFKHGIYSPFSFSSKCGLFHNSNVFGSCFIHILYTGCAKI